MDSKPHLLAIILLTVGLCCDPLRAVLRYAEVELLVKWQDGPESYAATVGNAAVGSTVKRNFNAIGWQQVKQGGGPAASALGVPPSGGTAGEAVDLPAARQAGAGTPNPTINQRKPK